MAASNSWKASIMLGGAGAAIASHDSLETGL